MSLKKYQYFFLFLAGFLAIFSFSEKSPGGELPRYEDPITEKEVLKEPGKEDSFPLGTFEEYEKRVFKNTGTDEKGLELLPNPGPTRTESLFYITKGWGYSTLETQEKLPHQNTLQSITNALSGVFGEDDLSYYFFNDFSDPLPRIAVGKKLLPQFQFIGEIGIQDIESLVGYSNGYLVLPPYLLEVDKETFSFIPKRYYIPSGYNRDYAKTEGWQFFINNGKQYTHYLGSDKDWIYRWSKAIHTDAYFIIREKKAGDFKLISGDQIKELYASDQHLGIKTYPLGYQKVGKLLCEALAEDPELYYFENRVYVFGVYNNWSFPVDGNSLQREEKSIVNGEDTISYYVLSDDRYYYQLLYHHDGAYYTLQKIKK